VANSAGLTWDFSTIPYNPFPQQWKKRFDAVVKAHDDWNLAGLMENHHYGWYPNFVAELAKEAYVRGGMPFDRHLRAIAARDFGEENADRAVAVWRAWSDRIVDMDSTNENQYGPFRYGPAYPFNAMEPDLKDSEFPLPPYHLIANYRKLAHPDGELALQVELFAPMAESFMDGGATFQSMADRTEDPAVADNARRMGWLGEYMGRCCLTAKHVKLAMTAERAGDRARVMELARAEHENVYAALKLVRADSRLGWEPTMHYGPGEKMMEWKLRYLESHYGIAPGKD